MSADDPTPDGIDFNIGKILQGALTPAKRTRRRRSTTSSSASGDLDAAMRRAVRAEVADVKAAIKDLAEEIVRLRRANEELADKVARLARG